MRARGREGARLPTRPGRSQVVDFGEMGPVRCLKCKAYMNPFMRFIDGGKQFVCNLCGALCSCPLHASAAGAGEGIAAG